MPKVALVDTTIMPPKSEIILAGRKVGGRWNADEKLGIVEPTTQLPESGQVLVAKALVNAEQEYVPLRVANLTSEVIGYPDGMGRWRPPVLTGITIIL